MRFESKLSDPYLDLVKKCLLGRLYPGAYRPLRRPSRVNHAFEYLILPIFWILKRNGLFLCRYVRSDLDPGEKGRDWPPQADTMIGLKRLENLHQCIEDVIRNEIPGDFIETGVWQGGACIFMRAALRAYSDKSRCVWVADSFEGLPKPDGRFRQDSDGGRYWRMNPVLAISLDQVKSNFSRYGLLDEQVRFLKGWFKDTLPAAPIERLAILRLDGDLYSSTLDSLSSLYPKLSDGGYAIIDDYGAIEVCRKAVDDFRSNHKISSPLIPIDASGVYWRKAA